MASANWTLCCWSWTLLLGCRCRQCVLKSMCALICMCVCMLYVLYVLVWVCVCVDVCVCVCVWLCSMSCSDIQKYQVFEVEVQQSTWFFRGVFMSLKQSYVNEPDGQLLSAKKKQLETWNRMKHAFLTCPHIFSNVTHGKTGIMGDLSSKFYSILRPGSSPLGFCECYRLL